MQREWRIRKSVEFQAVQRGGLGWRDNLIILRVAPNGRTTSRFGFTVGKGIGIAVVRNRVKRRLREAVRTKPVQGGWDIVMIARRETAAANFRQLQGSVVRLLQRAGLLEESRAHEAGEVRS